MKRTLTILLILAITLTTLTGCAAGAPQDEPSLPQSSAAQEPGAALDIGQGSTVFVFEATDDAGETSVWNIHTDETTVGAALLDVGLVEGDTGEYGFMVTSVNGLRADYEKDRAYWAFYVDGEFAMTGTDSTDIEQGKVYSLVYTAA